MADVGLSYWSKVFFIYSVISSLTRLTSFSISSSESLNWEGSSNALWIFFAGKEWTAFFGVITNACIEIKVLPSKLFDTLWPVFRDDNPDFCHWLNHLGIDFSGSYSCALGFVFVSVKLVYERFCYLRASWIVGANEKHFFLHLSSPLDCLRLEMDLIFM